MKTLLTISILLLSLTGCVEMIFDLTHKSKNAATNEYLKTQALTGDVEAQYLLGKRYCCGEYPNFDNVQALKWWCMAAKEGQRDAMLEVGKIYETSHKYKGSIIPRNNVLAYVYYTKSQMSGNDDAVELREKIYSLLSEEEKTNAIYLVGQWPVIGCEVAR